jgi:hypothetical protein
MIMNERIQELARQASVQTFGYIRDGYFEKKFAELLIKECVEVCLSQRDPANLNYKPSQRFAEAVKQHFGV